MNGPLFNAHIQPQQIEQQFLCAFSGTSFAAAQIESSIVRNLIQTIAA
jgi:hypothetical protein